MRELTQTQQGKLIRMQASMKISELYASYWTAMATTGATCRRNVFSGNHKLTKEELTDDALAIALRHIWTLTKISNNIALLFEGREEEMEP